MNRTASKTKTIMNRWTSAALASLLTTCALTVIAAQPARGPLRLHPINPRCFTDGTKTLDGSLRAVYLTGAHTWNNLVDMGRPDPPGKFDFPAYLDFLERYHHNFIRLWSGDGLGHKPVPYARIGPGTAKNGGLAVDLDRFGPAFFDDIEYTCVGETASKDSCKAEM